VDCPPSLIVYPFGWTIALIIGNVDRKRLNIWSLRRMCRLTQREAAERAGVPVAQWQSWERGVYLPNWRFACRIADALECTLDALRPVSGRAGRVDIRWLAWFGKVLPGFWQGEAFEPGRLFSRVRPHRTSADRMTWRVEQLMRAGILEYQGAGLYRLSLDYHKPPPLPIS
jgi:DNA-binding XRE family transcriptional regulator